MTDCFISLRILSSSFIHVVAYVRISFLCKTVVFHCHNFFILLSVGEHLGCFNAGMNMAV